MAATPLAIGEESKRDLERICQIPPTALRSAISALASHKRPIISGKTLRSVLAPAVGADVAAVLVRQLLSLGLLNTRRGRDIDDIVESLTLGLKKTWGSDGNEYLAKWLELSSDFAALLSNHQVLSAAKAFDLSYEFEHVLQSARIITDLRPVFNIERTQIIGTIICNRLSMTYDDDDNRKSISIAMSEEDLQELLEECKNALTKIELASRFPEAYQEIETMKAFELGEENP